MFPRVLLDTGAVIQCFAHGVWDVVIDRYDVYLTSGVIGEADFFPDESGHLIDIDLQPYIDQGLITEVVVTRTEAGTFLGAFGFSQSYVDRIDPGELEILTYAHKASWSDLWIVSGDAIVYKSLGRIQKTESSQSLEELLNLIGCTKNLPDNFSKRWRRVKEEEGSRDFILAFDPRTQNPE